MEKLSKKLQDILNEQDFCFTMEEMRTVEMTLARLSAYEDTGLTPAEIVHADKMLKDKWEMPLERLKEAIDLINAKDDGRLAPVRHGQWLLKHIGAGHMWECSCCHKRPCIYITEDTAYCPNCGAKMDGETRE